MLQISATHVKSSQLSQIVVPIPWLLRSLVLGISFVFFLGTWQLLTQIRHYPTFVLPPPTVVASRWIDEAVYGTLIHHIAFTLRAALGGWGSALLLSCVIGYLLAHAPQVERVVVPQLAAMQAVPVIAVAPLIILWMGIGLQSKILVAALVTFFPMLTSTIVALRGVPRELLEIAHISGATWWQTLRYVEVPLALPTLFGGIKAGLSLATTGAVVGEFVAGRDGLGALITVSRSLFDTPLLFAAILTLGGLTFVLYFIATVAEHVLVRWEW